jgi:predicted phosphodiesterase/uncharacterized Fe-S cluster-containing radical SAM superfamily protein
MHGTQTSRPILFDGPVLVFGGPYSNLEATRAVLAEAQRLGIAPEHVICTGDVVAYGADAKACVDVIRQAGIHVVMGNCEEALGSGAGDCGCGFAPGSLCDLASAAWFAHADRRLGIAERTWMRSLPRQLRIGIGGFSLAVIHGSASTINRFVFASTPERIKVLDLDATGVDGIIAGHCGLPFSQVIDGRLWHNPGVVGMPANDGTPRVWYSLLEPRSEQGALVIRHLALAYDHDTAALKMQEAGLPDGYAEALSTGLWPSCDVLPARELALRGTSLSPVAIVWHGRNGHGVEREIAWPFAAALPRLTEAKFRDPTTTASGEPRARVRLEALKTLWINTGTLCNLACRSCYIESTPRNDRLAYITAAEVGSYLDEIERDRLPTELIGFTGGEPFMNRELPAMLEDALARGFKALVLTNAMKPMQRFERQLLGLKDAYGDRLTIRVSVDHYTRELHELERGPGSWQPTIDGLLWLARHGFAIHVAGRLYSGEPEEIVRAGYGRLFAEQGIPVHADDPIQLVLFPEMDERIDVPELTDDCWSALGQSPDSVMCATSRMVAKRKGAEAPSVLACTLVAYDERFELGKSLREAAGPVALNHPHCARFCVLGGAACSRN